MMMVVAEAEEEGENETEHKTGPFLTLFPTASS